ncbi:MAG: FHA domain-containing protein [Bacteroidetes bacterium]|nr:FHA domain-containing protein [Bacteroidota bacterium]
MPARLFCKIGELAGSDFLIEEKATIGRLKQNEITLHPTFISGEHARIYFDEEENGYVLEDLGSSNGTMLDGMAVTEPIRLDRLHVITFADQFDFIFQTMSEALARRIATGAASLSTPRQEGEKTRMGDAFLPMPPLAATPPGEAAEKTRTEDAFEATPPLTPEKTPDELEKTHVGAFFGDLPPLPEQQDPREKTRIENAFSVTPPLAAADTDSGDDETVASAPPADQPVSFELEVTMPDGTRHVFLLKEGSNVVGRESTRTISLLDASISRDHALVTVRGENVFLKDLGSKNATFVDGEKLTDEVEILPETVIGFGRIVIASLRRKA